MYYDKGIDLDFVFYNNRNGTAFYEKGEGYWEHIRQHGYNDIREAYKKSGLKTTSNEFKDMMRKYADTRENMSQNERQKENKYLSKIDPSLTIDGSEGKEFLRKFNEISQGEERFKNLIDRLDIAIKRGEMTNEKGEFLKDRAPDMSAHFADYFASAFTDAADALGPDDLLRISEDPDEWDKFLNEAISEALEKLRGL